MINLHESTGPGWDSISRPLDSDSHLFPDTCYRLRKRSYWIQPNLFGDLLTQVGEQEHYCFLLFGSPLHGPQRVCIFWLNCSLFLNCWVELNQICAQLKQIVYTRAYFWVPHLEAPYNGVKSVCPFFFIPPASFVCGGYTVFTLSVHARVRVCVLLSVRNVLLF